MKLITSFTQEFSRIAEITIPAMRQYAAQHDLQFEVFPHESGGRPPHWGKMVAIQKTLDQGVDLVMWIDIDAMFVRMDVDVRTELSSDKDLFVVWHDWTNGGALELGFLPHANMGVLVVRNTAWSREFLLQLWQSKPPAHKWHDQAAFHHLVGLFSSLGNENGPDKSSHELLSRIGWLDLRWNSIPGVLVAPDPIVHHYAGAPISTRELLLQYDQSLGLYRDRLGLDQRRALTVGLHLIAFLERRSARLAASVAERYSDESIERQRLAERLQGTEEQLAAGMANVVNLQRGLTDRIRAAEEELAAAITKSGDIEQGMMNRVQASEAQLAAAITRLAAIEQQMMERLKASETQLAAAITRLAAIEQQMMERLKASETQLAAVHGSLSWRVTAPFRAASRALRALFYRLSRGAPRRAG